MRMRSYGERLVLQKTRGLGATDETSAEAIFGKIVGGLTEVAKVVVPAVTQRGTGSTTVDDLLKKLTQGTALQPTPPTPVATTAFGGISPTMLLLGALGLGAVVLLAGRRR